jgi:hypothetical protein
MINYCANPDCGAEFLYLHEGELFVIRLPDNGVQHYWLCPACAPIFRLTYDPSEGSKVVAKSGGPDSTPSIVRMAIGKPAGIETVSSGSLRKVA